MQSGNGYSKSEHLSSWKPRPVRVYRRANGSYFIYKSGKPFTIRVPKQYATNLNTAQRFVNSKLQATPVLKSKRPPNYSVAQLEAMAKGKQYVDKSSYGKLEDQLKLSRLDKLSAEISTKPKHLQTVAFDLEHKLENTSDDDPEKPKLEAELAAIPMALSEAFKVIDDIEKEKKRIVESSNLEDIEKYAVADTNAELESLRNFLSTTTKEERRARREEGALRAKQKREREAAIAQAKRDEERKYLETYEEQKVKPEVKPGKIKIPPKPIKKQPDRKLGKGLSNNEDIGIMDHLDQIRQLGKSLADIKSTGSTASGSTTSSSNPRPALWNDQIEDYFKGNPRFAGVFSVDEMKYLPRLELPFGFVVNMSKSNQPGTHWCSVYVTPDSIEYYDPTGHDPPKQLVQDLQKKLLEWHLPILLKFKINKIANQKNSSNHCGYFAIRFLDERFNGKPFNVATRFVDNEDPKNTDPENGESVINKEFKLI